MWAGRGLRCWELAALVEAYERGRFIRTMPKVKH